jgi:hypothetical protein
MYRCLFILAFYLLPNFAFSSVIRGKIVDEKTGGHLVGATIYIVELQKGTISGLDGTYIIKNVPEGMYTIRCSYVSYQTSERKINIKGLENSIADFSLGLVNTELDEIIVSSYRDKSTDLSARNSEKNASNIINVVSAKTIEMSPDLNVANVIQRMSGVTLDKSSSGSGQYAILRGMDKRYSYTLVNGVKIPSTNDKHRYVSLDIFPSDLVDRVEVTKSLTPDMEGDAIAGAINLVMKNAPEKFLIQANSSAGYSQFFSDHDFLYFDTSPINLKSPYELHEKGYNAIPSDFPTSNLKLLSNSLPVNFTSGLTVGNRFLNKKLGWILAGSYQNTYKGTNSLLFSDDMSNDGFNLPELSSMQKRIITTKSSSFGIHNKFDYQFNSKNRLELYTAFMDFDQLQVRESDNTDLSVSYDPTKGSETRTHNSRLQYNLQNLLNITLQGEHNLTDKLSMKWSGVYSIARNQTPGMASISYGNNIKNYQPYNWYVDFDGGYRQWRHNSDEDKAGYLDFKYKTSFFSGSSEYSLGGMYRTKDRSSFYNNYTLLPIGPSTNPDSIFYSEKGKDWNTYDQIVWRVKNPRGAVATSGNYGAFEDIGAVYGMFLINIRKWQIKGGVRLENTLQGYTMQYPIGESHPYQDLSYFDFLPSIHFRYSPFTRQNFRLSYYRATNKPGFAEIVPAPVVGDDYTTRGNFDLKHAIADNIDLRWEFFPSGLEQIMIGTFYKNIKDPIEFAFMPFNGNSHEINLTPINAGTAVNYGLEFDFIKYIREWGLKGNYTFTSSDITTNKIAYVRRENGDIGQDYPLQERPLYGQSKNVGNISLLYKSTQHGFNAQLAFSYTGDRIYTVSRYIDDDKWQKGYWQLDASCEKKLKGGFSIFAKAHNLLNTHVNVYLKKVNDFNNDFSYHSGSDTTTMIRDEYSKPSYLIGVRYKFN